MTLHIAAHVEYTSHESLTVDVGAAVGFIVEYLCRESFWVNQFLAPFGFQSFASLFCFSYEWRCIGSQIPLVCIAYVVAYGEVAEVSCQFFAFSFHAQDAADDHCASSIYA